MLLFTKFIKYRFTWLPLDYSHLGHSVWAPLLRESNSSFPTNITIFVVGRRKIWVQPDTFLSATWSVTVSTTFFSPDSILIILAFGHWFR